MDDLAKRSIVGIIQLILGLGVMLFAPAWSMDYWQAWVYILIFSMSGALIFFYLYKHDPNLLERRMQRAEKEKTQKWIQFFIFIVYISALVLPSLDHRFRWSEVPVLAVLAGEVMVALGYYIIFIVLKVNSFAARTIEVTPEQSVISTGPYAIIRHPMYSGALVMLLGTPLALGSWWGLVTFVLIAIMLVIRLRGEEKFLSQNLTGYKEYCQKVRFRLLPFIW